MQLSKKEKKRLYDMEYRRLNKEKLKEKKAKWFKAHYNPEKAAIERKLKSAQHSEYCRKPEYKKYKSEYDKIARHGEFRECYELMEQIFKIAREYYESKYERIKARGYYTRKGINDET